MTCYFDNYMVNFIYILFGDDYVRQLVFPKERIFSAFYVVFSLIWLSNLAGTDAYFSIYAMIGFVSFYLVLSHKVSMCKGKNELYSLILSIFFSVIVFLANYPLFTSIGDPSLIGRSTSILVNLINSFLSLTGGIFVSYPITLCFLSFFPLQVKPGINLNEKKVMPFAVFLSLLLINLVHLFFVEYPGNLSEDSFTQISEMVSGTFSNFNTYWHTKLFQFILSIGYALFSDLNDAVALFCILQTVILCAAFTYSLMTMVSFGIPGKWILVSYCIYAFLPYNIALSITVWKDVLFAAACLLMISSLLRIVKKLDTHLWMAYSVYGLSCLLFIISRTNGWLILLVSIVVSLPVLWKKKVLFLSAAMALTGWFMLNPALLLLGVSGGDMVESLSIPIQQVSRVIVDGGQLTPDEEELLSAVVDLEEVPDLYINWLSDPMKVEVRSKDYTYFQEHLGDYAKLWVQLGLRYPWEYVKAWVDQTKGYWNAGYDYPLYSEYITDNPYGVVKSNEGNPIASLFRLYFGLSRHVIFFEPLHSIGLHVWIVILCFLLNLSKRRTEWIICLPLLILLIGLWFGTPVYCSFRYVYPLFVSFPLVVSTALTDPQK